MNWSLFLSTFSVIFFAELPDKTVFATLLMATRGRAFAIFCGVALAFVVQSMVGVAFGGLIGMLPERWVHLGAGITFLLFAAYTWFSTEDEGGEGHGAHQRGHSSSFLKDAGRAFVVIFIAEWGDLTQIATASIAARDHDYPLTVFFSATLALWSVTAITIFLGRRTQNLLHGGHLKRISVVAFAAIGAYFIYTWAWG